MGDMPLQDEPPPDPLLLRDEIIAGARRHFERGETDAAIQLLRRLEFATIDDTTIRMTDCFLRPAIAGDRKVVASFDPSRRPEGDEIIVIYGNYPHMFGNIVVNNPIRRHVASFSDLEHDAVEHDAAWEPLGRLYVLNTAHRPDRYDAIMRELAAARAPFHRITRIAATIPDGPAENARLARTIGCSESHLAALRHAALGGFEHVMVLEDDFCFTSDLACHLADLRQFFTRRYDYVVCLLATSKYGTVVSRDDLVSSSLQPCTNAAGYLVSRAGIEELLRIQVRALDLLRSTGETDQYAFDRAWATLQQSGKLWVFKRKFGFQVASYSDIEGAIARYLD